jgi:hypothetical protein
MYAEPLKLERELPGVYDRNIEDGGRWMFASF